MEAIQKMDTINTLYINIFVFSHIKCKKKMVITLDVI
jgi:hypothetical protein